MRHTGYHMLSLGTRFTLLVIGLLAVTTAIYWPGMHGPVLLDDIQNLLPISGWLNGQYDWRFVVFGNHSGPLGRPVSMATFLLDAAATRSTDSFTFKPTNLAIHLACGLAVLWLALQAFRRWQPTRGHAHWAALALAAAWLWLPLNVDTVLYIVQRMAQLSALFVLLALGCYMAARERIARGQRRGHLLLWIGVPALTALAAFSKENGVLALPLALVLELFLFGQHGERRPTSTRLFFALTVALPLLCAVVYVAVNPDFILGGYAGRDFTLVQRLLTEPRVLWSYVQTLLVPLGPRMGFFQDNFPVSTGLLQPWTTLPAIAAWIAVAVAGWTWRRGNPLFGAGVFLFLVGQSLESGPIALELYFEHRNYLPSFGVLLAVAGTLVWAWQRLPSPTPAFRRIAAALLGVVLALYAVGTWGHVQGWRNSRTFFVAQGVFNPTSTRFQSYLVAAAINQHNLAAALEHTAVVERHGGPDLRAATTLWRVLAYCSAKVPPPAALYDELDRRAHGRLVRPAQQALSALVDDAETGCRGLDVSRLEAILKRWLSTTPTPATSAPAWQTRYKLARMVAANGRLRDARGILERAFRDSGHDSHVGVLLFQLNGSLGDVAACREVLAKLEQQQGRGDLHLDRAIARFRKALTNGEIHVVPEAAGGTSQ